MYATYRLDSIYMSTKYYQNKRISNTDGCSQNKCLFEKGCKLISVMLWTNENNSYIILRELWFLYTVPLLIGIYLKMKFQVDTSYRFLCYAPDKFMTDGRTKWQLYALPLGSIISQRVSKLSSSDHDQNTCKVSKEWA